MCLCVIAVTFFVGWQVLLDGRQDDFLPLLVGEAIECLQVRGFLQAVEHDVVDEGRIRLVLGVLDRKSVV